MAAVAALSFWATSFWVLPVMERCTCLPVPGSAPSVYRASQYSYFLPLRVTVFFRIVPVPFADRPAIRENLLSFCGPVCYHKRAYRAYISVWGLSMPPVQGSSLGGFFYCSERLILWVFFFRLFKIFTFFSLNDICIVAYKFVNAYIVTRVT